MRNPKPRGPRDPAFQALQKLWDTKLKESGFTDIEGGIDLNTYDASSLPTKRQGGSRNTQGTYFIPLIDEDRAYTEGREIPLSAALEQATTSFGSERFADHPCAEAWRKFIDGAHQLPDGPTKRLLLAIAEEGCISADVKVQHRTTTSKAMRVFQRHCEALKLPKNRLLVGGRTKKKA